MKRHLNKKIKCNNKNNIDESNEEYIYNNSLIQYNILNELELSIKNKFYICKICKKKFHNKSNLNRHSKSLCEINNNVYNEKIILGFDEDWNIVNITNEYKEKLLLSESKFTNTLKYILNNEINFNIIIKDINIGFIYNFKNNQYEAKNTEDIFDLLIDKIYLNLVNFYNDLNIEKNMDIDLLNSINNKYNLYKKNLITKNEVNNCLFKIYNDIKTESIKKLMEIIIN
jgi:hypothetical protein